MDGVLLIDKPSGPTSHDVVARIRRSSKESRVGHTGTLDPNATGLLTLVLGRATRLASRVLDGLKTYEAIVQLGFATDTDDAAGRSIGEPIDARPSAIEIEQVLAAFRGTFDQVPPTHSAKKVGGRKAYDLARRSKPVVLAPVSVTVHSLECVGVQDSAVSIRVTATPGFYVRSLARDIGARLGCGGHLSSLRRTRSGAFDVAAAMPLAEAEALGPDIAGRLTSPAEALPHLASAILSEQGLDRVLHGGSVGPEHLTQRHVPSPSAGEVRLVAADGRLVALAHSRGGALHPVVVLG